MGNTGTDQALKTGQSSYDYVHHMLVNEFDIPASQISPEARLNEDLEIDSIDAVDMMVQMREVTGRRISPEHFKNVRTVQDVVDIVAQVMS